MLTIIHQFNCDFCDSTDVRDTQKNLAPHYTVSQNFVPYGWRWFGHDLVCPRHEIIIGDFDDKEQK